MASLCTNNRLIPLKLGTLSFAVPRTVKNAYMLNKHNFMNLALFLLRNTLIINMSVMIFGQVVDFIYEHDRYHQMNSFDRNKENIQWLTAYYYFIFGITAAYTFLISKFVSFNTKEFVISIHGIINGIIVITIHGDLLSSMPEFSTSILLEFYCSFFESCHYFDVYDIYMLIFVPVSGRCCI